MYSYDWITLVTLGLDRWQQDRHNKTGHQIELEEAAERHRQAQKNKPIEATQPKPLRAANPRAC